MRPSRGIFVASALAALGAGCVSVTNVRGPDGETAHLIKCPSSDACLAKADELCPDGYVLRSSGTNISGYVSNGSGSVSSQQEILVSCKADLPTAPEAPGAIEARAGARVCAAAYPFVDDFAKYWAAHTPGSRLLEEKALESDFVAACASMPENVQRCMHEKYRAAHEKACDAVLMRLEPSARAKIDALFLEAPAPVPASSGKSL